MNKFFFVIFLLLIATFSFAQTPHRKIDSLIALVAKTIDRETNLKILKAIYDESKAAGYQNGLASYYIYTGVNLFNSGRFDEALKVTYTEEKMIFNTGDYRRISHLFALRGNCFSRLMFFEKSQDCLSKAREYAGKINGVEDRYVALARVYKITATNFKLNPKTKNADSVLHYQKMAYKIQQQIAARTSDYVGMYIQAAAIGRQYFEIENNDSAKRYFNIAVDLTNKYDLPKYGVDAWLGLGHIHFKTNQLDSSLKFYFAALSGAQQRQNPVAIKESYQSIAKTYERLNDYVSAKEYYKKYAVLADSLAHENKLAAAEPMGYILKDREELAEKQKLLRKVYIIAAACVFILSLTILVILYRNYKKSKQNNIVLANINRQMLVQNDYLRNTLNALEESAKRDNSVMQVLTHDLRSPIAAIVGLSDFMMSEHNLTGEDLEMTRLINISGQDSLKFINELLQKETVEEELDKEVIDLQQLLNYCVTQLQYTANHKEQTILLHSEPVSIAVHRGKIWRVMSNLINNAIKFSGKGTTIQVTLSIEDAEAIIAVADKGIGIPDELKDKIFGNTLSSKREGTSGEKSFGLGLAIVRQIVSAHHGRTWFESKVGDGTTFFIALPIT